ncbi:hypothetical protein CEXT_23051 [Caerostris extrusa]|uniref:Uncharacterized protein n=1 Tax=Caerostris extrusa TaxID=172846 RepID=A0AAV4P0X2_CAEEX|nr:hypothetical protein CEXT_23051 [Caerostris extrusa]
MMSSSSIKTVGIFGEGCNSVESQESDGSRVTATEKNERERGRSALVPVPDTGTGFDTGTATSPHSPRRSGND